MTDVTYTETLERDSSVVDYGVYDERTKELTVVLHGNAYRYSSVPKTMADAYHKVTSIGANWLPTLKREYGPSEDLGQSTRVNWIDVSRQPVPVGAATPKDLRESEGMRDVPEVAHFPMKATEKSPQAALRFRIHFLNGKDKRKYDLTAETLEDALVDFAELQEMLGVEFPVRKVTAYFD